MKVTASREVLLRGLQRVLGIVERRQTLPNVSQVLLEAKGDGLEISATDLEVGLRGRYPATVKTAGSVMVGARSLWGWLREIQETDVMLTVGENLWVTVSAGRSVCKMAGVAGSEFPALPAVEREGVVPLEAEAWRRLIRRTVFAVGDHDSRYVLNGLLVTVVKTADGAVVRCVGTDGHRLAVAEEPLLSAEGVKLAATGVSAIVPKKAAGEIVRLLDEDDDESATTTKSSKATPAKSMVGVSKKVVVFRKSGVVLTARVIEGQYPNYEQVMPKASGKTVTVRRTDLEGALRRVTVLGQDKTTAVKLSCTGKTMTLFASHSEMGESEDVVAATLQGEEWVTGFNARYLLDALSVVDGENVELDMASALSPCLLRDPDAAGARVVVMPVKV